MRSLLFVSLFLVLPLSALAVPKPASFLAARSLVTASSSPGNAHFVGISVVNIAAVLGDLSAIGGSIITTAPIQGDALLLAGSIRSQSPVAGDLRAMGGSVDIDGPVSGDFVALGFSVRHTGPILGSAFAVGANVDLSHGAEGPVTIYGNNIALAGDFGSDVTVVAAGRLTLGERTKISGSLSYEAPEEAYLPASATISGGVTYRNASYLPDIGTSRALTLVNFGFFLLVRILGALILAGLLAGLFPRLAEAVVIHAYGARPRNILFTASLGFGILVAVPVLTVLLTLSFVGMGLALLLFLLYALLLLLALLYAGILLGGALARRFMKRERILWHDGVVGMLALSLMSLVPYAGFVIAALLTVFSMGALLQIFFHFAFPSDAHTAKLL